MFPEDQIDNIPESLAEKLDRPALDANVDVHDIETSAGDYCFVMQLDFSRVKSVKITGQSDHADMRSMQAQLAEAVGLAEAIELKIVSTSITRVNKFTPATLFGKGKVEELGKMLSQYQAQLVVVNTVLTPVQQRNLEEAWGVKVLDRTGLILEIFGARAQTKEGQLQVSLANLNYQRGRLVRSWTHLERQRGGTGFTGGPGETQLESDRRGIQMRITKLEKQLAQVKRTRGLHRTAREKVPYPIVALVGYTNAGKSSLFNTLSGAEVMVKDMLFATLDPTMRQVELPTGMTVIMSDTVGFISNLPHELVSAFRATLEEVLSADIILHVEDIASEDQAAQEMDVKLILKDLGIGEEYRIPIVRVWNKIDLLSEDEKSAKTNIAAEDKDIIPVSALKSIGLEELSRRIENVLQKDHHFYQMSLSPARGAELAWIYRHCQVKQRTDLEDGMMDLNILVDAKHHEQFRNKFHVELNLDLREEWEK
ncbi:MAG: GTPase HflX [Hyphomicrobiales bacterium]|nr:GTPase HflX [Hyphomicrobiales bacterium]